MQQYNSDTSRENLNPNLNNQFNQGYQQQGLNMQNQGYPQPGFNPQNQGYPNTQPYSQGYRQQPINMNQGPMNSQVMVNFGGVQMQVYSDPMYILSQTSHCFVKQSIEMLEVLTGCETQNRYNVYTRAHNGVMTYLFKCKEDSGCCERYYCKGDSRPFNMKLKHVTNPHIDDDFMDTFCLFDRPWKCTCCCLARPVLSAYYKQKQEGNSFGSIEEPLSCYDPVLFIRDSSGFIKYKIHADCCQCGIICRNSICGKCSETMFGIYPANCEEFHMKHKVGLIRKIAGDAIKEMFTDADSFEIVFPDESTPEEKLLLIGAVLMIDYRFYEENPRNRNRMVGESID